MRGDDYKFMPIVDAMACINQRVNIIAVVVESSFPKRTRGSDLFCSVKILDESRTTGGYAHFFAETMDSLPQVVNTGDILVAHKFTVKTWKGGEAFAEFNKRFSYFALFDGRDSSIAEPVPYQISSKYKASDQDKNFVRRLRKWSIQQNISALQETVLLREIKESEKLSLFCKILYISNDNENEPILFVWDGTDTPPAPLEAKLEDELENPLPLQIGPAVLSRDILCTFPSVGSIMRMSVDQGDQKLGLHYLKPNRWVKLTNVRCGVRAALWTAVLQPFSKVCYLRDDEEAVIDRLRAYEKRFASKWRRMPYTSLPWPSRITETVHPDVAFVTLMDILTYPEVTCTFKCVVRVVAICPWSTEIFFTPSGLYRVRLTLEDPTARIHAYLYAQNGVKFFGDFQSDTLLRKRCKMLLGVGNEEEGLSPEENVVRNPPWIQCCLFSYFVDKNDEWGSRNYSIFDTTLVDHE